MASSPLFLPCPVFAPLLYSFSSSCLACFRLHSFFVACNSVARTRLHVLHYLLCYGFTYSRSISYRIYKSIPWTTQSRIDMLKVHNLGEKLARWIECTMHTDLRENPNPGEKKPWENKTSLYNGYTMEKITTLSFVECISYTGLLASAITNKAMTSLSLPPSHSATTPLHTHTPFCPLHTSLCLP